MMNCLCCGKPLTAGEMNGWHKRCIRRFFGTNELPELDISENTLRQLADESTSRGLTVPGVQKKLSLHLQSSGGVARLTLVDYPTGYILKPQDDHYPAMPESEHLVMQLAELSGISVVPHALIMQGEKTAYITKRIDRIPSKHGIQKLAMEDFAQLDMRPTTDKYNGSYERCSKLIERYSSRPGLDQAEFFMRVVFSYLTGNSDMHLKNFSLIETREWSGEYILSPAYDLLPVHLLLPEDVEELALTMNGKKRNLHKKDFLLFAQSCGIQPETARRMIQKLVSLRSQYEEVTAQSFLPEKQKKKLMELINSRCNGIS